MDNPNNPNSNNNPLNSSSSPWNPPTDPTTPTDTQPFSSASTWPPPAQTQGGTITPSSSPINQSPSSWAPPASQPTSSLNPTPQPDSPSSANPAPQNTWSAPQTPPISNPDFQNPLSSSPTLDYSTNSPFSTSPNTQPWNAPQDNSSSFTAPAENLPPAVPPVADLSNPYFSQPQTQPNLNNTYSEPPPAQQATPQNDLVSSPQPSTGGTPLDNPWGAPSQAPTIDGTQFSQPAPADMQTTADLSQSTAPAWTLPTTSNDTSNSQTTADTASVPTDLSHLITNNNAPQAEEVSQANTSETLVMPSAATPDIPTIPTESKKGVPKWLIGVGIGLLILVAGASAYFILGVGKPLQAPTSIPAQVNDSNQQVKPPAPIVTPPPAEASAQPDANGSANFGQLEGSGTPASSPQATSAADLLRQRQGR